MEFDGFDWDEGNWPKCGKHGVSRAEIETLFDSPDLLTGPDLNHSDIEQREFAAGTNPVSGRKMLLTFTMRYRDDLALVRPVSARFMHAKEARKYDSTRDT
jgi:uncharacterized DUF497 family protein